MRNSGQPRQHNDRHEGEPVPGVDKNRNRQRPRIVADQIDRLVDQVKRLQRMIQNAVGTVKYPLPENRDHDGRYNPGNDHPGPRPILEAPRLVEEQRDGESQHGLRNAVAQHPDQAFAPGGPVCR
ncbi:hypothetical protein D3C71_1498980 [compost metagenome]